MFASVVTLFQPFSELTYKLPPEFPDDFWRPGQRVAIPLGAASTRAGYISAISSKANLPAGVKCKTLYWPLEKEPVLTDELIALAKDLSVRQSLAPGIIFGAVLPPGLRDPDILVKTAQGQTYAPKAIAALPETQKRRLACAFASGGAFAVSRAKDEPELEYCELRVDPPWPTRPGAKLQNEILEFLHDRGSISRKLLLKSLGASRAQALKTLLQAGYVSLSKREEEPFLAGDQAEPKRDFNLNEEQEKALTEITAALESGAPQSRLLYGVTGSGKTAVYLEAARRALALGKSVLLLAPEVALAYKLFKDASREFNNKILFYHGYLTPASRERIYRESARRPTLVIGSRSALFLPLKNPGLFILDEEHDASYKQDEVFAYHAKELAWFRANHNRAVLALGSATPDLKTFYAVQNGALPMSRLTRRVCGAQTPPIELVDIGSIGYGTGALANAAAGESLLARQSEEELLNRVKNGEQAVVLLNRRGYAPITYCLECGKPLRCPNCEISLAYHKNRQKLICHYCGYSAPYPSPCPDCGKNSCLALGEGTEKIAERLETIAGAPVLRLDRDTSRRRGAMEEILAAFAANKSPFLVGTQMLSKGHHFPNVTLALVADGDIGLNLPDYRAAERSFQLLLQAAGRAGRGSKPGRVLIQTRNVNHYFWKYLLNSDYEGFYREELARRKKRNYPPFSRLSLTRLSHEPSLAKATEALNELGSIARETAKALGAQALGPAPAPIPFLRGKKRYQILIKSPDWQSARLVYNAMVASPASRRLRLFLDLDPVNML